MIVYHNGFWKTDVCCFLRLTCSDVTSSPLAVCSRLVQDETLTLPTSAACSEDVIRKTRLKLIIVLLSLRLTQRWRQKQPAHCPHQLPAPKMFCVKY